MPILSTFIESMNSSNRITANLRYCDLEASRHLNSGNTCHFAAPEITSLVPPEQRRSRVRDGLNCSHFSFNAIRGASLRARINKRFESIENDRHENIVDILNSINEKSGDFSESLKKVVSLIDKEGTDCKILKTISDAFSDGGLMYEFGRNTTFISNFCGNLLDENKRLRQDLNEYHLENKTLFQCAFDRLIKQNDEGFENMLQMNRTAIETNDKISKIAESVVDRQIASEVNPEEVNNHFKEILNLSSDNVNELREVKEKISSNEVELSSVKYELQLLETVFKKNGLEMKQDLDELKQELREIKDEMRLMREAITDVLPNKLIEAFKTSNDRYSFMGSDLEIVDSQNEDLELTE
jgi:hypothetical protein